jgi:cysteine desulfurase
MPASAARGMRDEADGMPVYLDHAATTPVDERVAALMSECLTAPGDFGNPSSEHLYGRAARARVEQARVQAAALVGCGPSDLIWTSGATESNNLAILGTARGAAGARAAAEPRGAAHTRVSRGHVVTARTEHKSVLDACHALEREGFAVSYLLPDGDGLIDAEAVRAALREDTLLVSIMHANNETGVLQDIAAIAAVCHERDVCLHVDAAQSVGKIPVDVAALGADLLGFTAHKLYGPKGVGALYAPRAWRAGLQPLLHGGGQEHGLRAGTLPVHQIAGFGLACELAGAMRGSEEQRLAQLTEQLWRGLADLEGTLLNGHRTQRVPGILNVSFVGVEGESLLAGLTELAVSSGSACNSDTDEPSYVLRALGRDAQLAQSSLRFSLGRSTRAQDIELAVRAVRREVRRLRAVAP